MTLEEEFGELLEQSLIQLLNDKSVVNHFSIEQAEKFIEAGVNIDEIYKYHMTTRTLLTQILNYSLVNYLEFIVHRKGDSVINYYRAPMEGFDEWDGNPFYKELEKKSFERISEVWEEVFMEKVKNAEDFLSLIKVINFLINTLKNR